LDGGRSRHQIRVVGKRVLVRMPRRVMVTVVALNAAVQLWSQNWPIETRELDASVGKIWAAHGKLETCGVTGLDGTTAWEQDGETRSGDAFAGVGGITTGVDDGYWSRRGRS
jgi:hypothetical protein